MEQILTSSEKLKEFLETHYGRKLSDEEYAEHKKKIVHLFSLLIEIDQRQKRAMRGGEKK